VQDVTEICSGPDCHIGNLSLKELKSEKWSTLLGLDV